MLTLVTAWVSDGQRYLADLGYEGEPDIFKILFKKTRNGELTVDEQAHNAAHGALRCLGERANSRPAARLLWIAATRPKSGDPPSGQRSAVDVGQIDRGG